jgi:hypothetical protein
MYCIVPDLQSAPRHANSYSVWLPIVAFRAIFFWTYGEPFQTQISALPAQFRWRLAIKLFLNGQYARDCQFVPGEHLRIRSPLPGFLALASAVPPVF